MLKISAILLHWSQGLCCYSVRTSVYWICDYLISLGGTDLPFSVIYNVRSSDILVHNIKQQYAKE